MIDYISGLVGDRGPGWIVIINNGLGFRIEIPLNMSLTEDQDGCVSVYTRLVVREDMILLFGFSTMDQRNLFNMVTGVSGMGPRVALSILSIMPVSGFYIAILEEDLKKLCRIPGIGKKTAQRLILELKEKLPSFSATDKGFFSENAGGFNSIEEEALNALCVLGFSQGEATDALRLVKPVLSKDASLESILKVALQKMSNR